MEGKESESVMSSTTPPKNEVPSAAKTEEVTQQEETHVPRSGCGFLGRYPVVSILTFAVAGVAIGAFLCVWDPSNPNDKEVAVKWVGLIGDMFIRALKAVVLPLVFVNMILSIADMMAVGRASTVGVKTIALYLFTTVVASILGVISIMIFKPLFETADAVEESQSRFQLGCNVRGGDFLVHDSNGNVLCTGNLTDDGPAQYFSIVDVDGTYQATAGRGPAELTVSDTIYNGVFRNLITSNIFASFVEANFAAVVLFAIFMGAALSTSLLRKKMDTSNSIFISFLKEVDGILIQLIYWIILFTPFAVLSLIARYERVSFIFPHCLLILRVNAMYTDSCFSCISTCSAVGKQTDLTDSFSNVGVLCISVIVGLFVQVFFVYTGIFYFITRDNPFGFFKYLIPAQTTAFACASSAATMPVSLQCAEASGRIPKSIARFVIPVGATINMDGSAIYFPCTCVWLAALNGITPTFANYIMLVIVSTIGSAGTAPVPSAGIIMVLTVYNSVFNTTGIPNGFEFVVGVDWFLNRIRAAVNVTGDNIVAASIAHMVSLEEFDTSRNEDDEEVGAGEGSDE
eukprot:scaffold3351_cov80-Cylindrotheca_fusiformis.AAC.2